MAQQTKREYLVAKGLAKPGRGRLSLAAKEEIKKAINKGIKFDEGGSASSDVPETPPARTDRPKGMYTFINPDGTKFKRLHTVACVDCSYSLQWCYCPQGPSLWVQPYVPGTWDLRATVFEVPSLVITTNDVPEKQPERGGQTVRRGRGRPRGTTTRARKAA